MQWSNYLTGFVPFAAHSIRTWFWFKLLAKYTDNGNTCGSVAFDTHESRQVLKSICELKGT